MSSDELTAEEEFFYEHAGFSYDPKTETPEVGRRRNAQTLATAEQKLMQGPYFITWEPDPEPWDGEMPYNGPLWVAALWSVDGTSGQNLLGSLGGIACEEGDPYQRVIAAELMAEHLNIDP